MAWLVPLLGTGRYCMLTPLSAVCRAKCSVWSSNEQLTEHERKANVPTRNNVHVVGKTALSLSRDLQQRKRGWEPDRHSAVQEFMRLLLKPNIHYHGLTVSRYMNLFWASWSQATSSIYLFIYLSIYLSMYGSTVLLLDIGRLFSFLIPYTVGTTPWMGDQPVTRLLPTDRATQT
jgi:hypothetical protein